MPDSPELPIPKEVIEAKEKAEKATKTGKDIGNTAVETADQAQKDAEALANEVSNADKAMVATAEECKDFAEENVNEAKEEGKQVGKDADALKEEIMNPPPDPKKLAESVENLKDSVTKLGDSITSAPDKAKAKAKELVEKLEGKAKKLVEAYDKYKGQYDKMKGLIASGLGQIPGVGPKLQKGFGKMTDTFEDGASSAAAKPKAVTDDATQAYKKAKAKIFGGDFDKSKAT